jgi:hypothetical protein
MGGGSIPTAPTSMIAYHSFSSMRFLWPELSPYKAAKPLRGKSGRLPFHREHRTNITLMRPPVVVIRQRRAHITFCGLFMHTSNYQDSRSTNHHSALHTILHTYTFVILLTTLLFCCSKSLAPGSSYWQHFLRRIAFRIAYSHVAFALVGKAVFCDFAGLEI